MQGTPVDIALVGAGTMGVHHARVVAESPRARLCTVVDRDNARATAITDAFGGVPSTDLAAVKGCQAAIVAATTEEHLGVATELLDRGIPLLIEKPLSLDIADTRRIVAASECAGVPITCGFVERFNPVVMTVHGLLRERPVHLVSVRHSPPTPRAKTSVVHDLLIHDIDLATRLCPGNVASIASSSWVPQGMGAPEVADAMLTFGGGELATLSADRWSQRKVRTFSVSTGEMLFELDLLRQDLTVYRHVRHEQLADRSVYRAETVVDIPFVRHQGEPILLQLDHFLDLIAGRVDADEERRSILPAHEIAAEVASTPPLRSPDRHVASSTSGGS